jgi:hypothetical protein
MIAIVMRNETEIMGEGGHGLLRESDLIDTSQKGNIHLQSLGSMMTGPAASIEAVSIERKTETDDNDTPGSQTGTMRDVARSILTETEAANRTATR